MKANHNLMSVIFVEFPDVYNISKIQIESKSQQETRPALFVGGCLQYFKDTN